MKQFEIDIIDHHWIDRDPDNVTDTCSHGRFLLRIGGVVILGEDDAIDDWTTSSSILRLLKTIGNDSINDRELGIILHCGGNEMISCPIAVDWQLQYEGDMIRICGLKKYPSVNDGDVIAYPGLSVEISKGDYASEIVKVATQVKAFFAASKPRKGCADGEEVYDASFWNEFDLLLEKYS